jgi:hypothetical protein
MLQTPTATQSQARLTCKSRSSVCSSLVSRRRVRKKRATSLHGLWGRAEEVARYNFASVSEYKRKGWTDRRACGPALDEPAVHSQQASAHRPATPEASSTGDRETPDQGQRGQSRNERVLLSCSAHACPVCLDAPASRARRPRCCRRAQLNDKLKVYRTSALDVGHAPAQRDAFDRKVLGSSGESFGSARGFGERSKSR